MFRSTVSASVQKDPKTAGEVAASAVRAKLSDVGFAFVYASADYDLKALLSGVKAQLPQTPIIGNTSFKGVITPEGFATGEDGFVGILALADSGSAIAVAASPKGKCARATGRKVAEEALRKAGKGRAPDYFYMVASPGEEEFYLKGIAEVIGRAPYFGGSAADNAIAGQWSIFTDDAIFSDGVAVAFFYTDRPLLNIFTGAYNETDDVGIITKVANNRTLVEIDGEPALQKYAAWAGVDPNTLKGMDLLVYTITSPLGVKDRLGDLTAIRHPMNGNDDNSMAIGANLAEKTAIIRMAATIDELIAAASQTLIDLKAKCETPPAAFHLVHCGGRLAGIGDRITEVADAVKKVAGDIPYIMEFTFGEYGFAEDGNNTTGGLMLSYSAIV